MYSSCQGLVSTLGLRSHLVRSPGSISSVVICRGALAYLICNECERSKDHSDHNHKPFIRATAKHLMPPYKMAHHQLTSPFFRSKPPLSCRAGFTTFPCSTVNLTIPSQSSGRTLASHMHCEASLSPSVRRYTITFAENLCPPTWLIKYMPTPPGLWSCRSRYRPSGRSCRSNSRLSRGADCPQRASRVRWEHIKMRYLWGQGRV